VKIIRKSLWMLFVASRYLKTKRKKNGVTSSLLSIATITVGVTALISVISVMNGFQEGTIKNILEVNSYHIRITPKNRTEALPENTNQFHFGNSVAAVVPLKEEHTMIAGTERNPIAVFARGVPKNMRTRDVGFAETVNITNGKFDVSQRGSIVIGSELARNLNIKIGSKISLLQLHKKDGKIIAPLYADYVVEGIFKTGFYDYDRMWVFLSLDDDLFESSPGIVAIKLKNISKTAEYISLFSASPVSEGYRLEAWEQYNSAIFGALRIEKNTMLILIGLIFLVAGATIAQTLRRSIYERLEDLAVIKAIGASPLQLRLIFVFEGFLIGLFGSLFGTSLGMLLTVNINEVFQLAEKFLSAILGILNALRYTFEGTGMGQTTFFSPTVFYIQQIPVQVNPYEVFLIVLVAFFSTTLTSFAASKRVSIIRPAEVLHYE
jgi:lipoprotein-releasing system permease protein